MTCWKVGLLAARGEVARGAVAAGKEVGEAEFIDAEVGAMVSGGRTAL